MKNSLIWFPRILSILFILFLSLFSLDIFVEGVSFWQSLLAFTIHSIPSLILIIILIFSWRHALVGAIGYFLAAIIYMILILGDFNLITFLVLGAPLVIISTLFAIVWQGNKRGR